MRQWREFCAPSHQDLGGEERSIVKIPAIFLLVTQLLASGRHARNTEAGRLVRLDVPEDEQGLFNCIRSTGRIWRLARWGCCFTTGLVAQAISAMPDRADIS